MGLFNRERIAGKTLEQLAGMRVAGLLVGQTLALLADTVRPGMTTLELDTLAETHIRDHGGVPNFQLVPGYRHTLCTSVNDEIVHGIPGDRVLQEGDLLSIDCGAQVGQWNGDAAVSCIVGGREAGRPEDLALIDDNCVARRDGAARRLPQAVGLPSRTASPRRGAGRAGAPHVDYVGHASGLDAHGPAGAELPLRQGPDGA